MLQEYISKCESLLVCFVREEMKREMRWLTKKIHIFSLDTITLPFLLVYKARNENKKCMQYLFSPMY